MKIRSFGRPLFVFLPVHHDSARHHRGGHRQLDCRPDDPVLQHVGPNAGNWVLVYTSAIMFVLRFFCRADCASDFRRWVCWPPARRSLVWDSTGCRPPDDRGMIFLAATCYGLGKSFFWPTTLGVVSEQFPKGGALTLNAIAGVGMISVGVPGKPFAGCAPGPFPGSAPGPAKPGVARESCRRGAIQIRAELSTVWTKIGLPHCPPMKRRRSNRSAWRTIKPCWRKSPFLPAIMFGCYLSLILYFRSKGGLPANRVGR